MLGQAAHTYSHTQIIVIVLTHTVTACHTQERTTWSINQESQKWQSWLMEHGIHATTHLVQLFMSLVSRSSSTYQVNYYFTIPASPESQQLLQSVVCSDDGTVRKSLPDLLRQAGCF